MLRTFFTILTFAIFSTVLVIQINQYPLDRFPNWDHLWIDAMQVSKLASFKDGLIFGELPAINPYIGFGWNYLGDTTLLQSILLPINWMILWLPAEEVIIFRTVFFLFLLALGGFLYLRNITKKPNISLAGSFILMSLPYLYSMAWMTTFFNFICIIPLLLYRVDRAISQPTAFNHGFIAIIILLVGNDILSLMTLLPLIFTYSLSSSIIRFHISPKDSLIITAKFVFIIIVCSAFFLIPFLNNLSENSSYMHKMIDAGLAERSGGIELFSYLSFIRIHGLASLLIPTEGSGILLYIPIAIWLLALLPFFHHKALIKTQKSTFIALYPLFIAALTMLLLPIMLHGLPFISSRLPSYFRSSLNAIPFLLTLSSIICLSLIQYIPQKRKVILKILLFAIVFEALIFIIPHPYISYMDVNHSLILPDIRSSLLVPLNFSNDMWPALPLSNALLMLILWWISNKDYSNTSQTTNIKNLLPVFAIAFWAFISVSLQSELRRQMSQWQFISRNNEDVTNYILRNKQWSAIVNLNSPDYRTLPAAKAFENTHTGRNRNLILETELNSNSNKKTLFSYRETTHPYESLLYSAITGTNTIKANRWFPPLSNQLVNVLPLLRFTGIRWIVSANEPINNDKFILHDVYHTHHTTPINPENSDKLYLYEIKNNHPVAFFTENIEIVSQQESWRRILNQAASPWDHGIVYLESNKNNPKPENKPYNSFNKTEQPKIINETYNSVTIRLTPTDHERHLILTYIHRPFWNAYINDKKVSVERAYGGFMATLVPAGAQEVHFQYKPWDVYAGLFISLTGTVSIFIFGMISTKNNRRR